MSELERARVLAISAASEIAHVLPKIFPDILQIAETSSPSSAFNRAAAIARVKGLDPREQLAAAKLARWLAVVRRDYGDAEFNRLATEIASIAGLVPQAQPQQGQMAIQVPRAPRPGGIVPGIYKYGDYSWLGEARLDKVKAAFEKITGEGLPDYLSQLAIEVFYSLYLLNTELHRRAEHPQLKPYAEVTEPIRGDAQLRASTVMDEFLSAVVAAKILASVYERVKERGLDQKMRRRHQAGQCPVGAPAPGGQGQQRDEEGEEIAGAVREAVEEAKEEAKRGADKDKEVEEIIGGIWASKHGHELSFEDKVDLYLTLRERPIFAKSLLEAIRTVKEEPGRIGGTIDFRGYRPLEDYEELPASRPTDIAVPGDLFDVKVANKDIEVADYKQGTKGKKRKFVIAIDKSGSMERYGKIEWARAVAAALAIAGMSDDVKVFFFDVEPWDAVDLSRDFVNGLKRILSVKAEGGTSIDKALKYADEVAPGYTTVIITDGEDDVYYTPRNETIAVMVGGDNESLRRAAKKYVRVEEISGRAIKDIIS